MYALINRFSENILYVTIMVGNDGCTQYHIDEDGDIPLIHPIPKHFHNIIEGNFPEYEYSFNYPYLGETNIQDVEVRRMYMSYEELANEEDS